jgi:hypothetical protein
VSYARVLVFALAMSHAVGIADLVIEDTCEDACSDDGCEDCTPGVACRCHCPSTMPLLGGTTTTIAKVTTPELLATCDAGSRMHANPDPREILHVPRLA